MKLKQTAALGLSALIIGSNMLLPYAAATTMAMSSQPELPQQFADINRNPVFLAMAEEHVQHPIEAQKPDEKAEKKHRWWHFLNPFAFLFDHHKPAKTAASVAVKPAIVKPMEPEITPNPALTAEAQPPKMQAQPDAEAKHPAAASHEQKPSEKADGASTLKEAPAQKENYTQINLPPEQPQEQPAQPPITGKPALAEQPDTQSDPATPAKLSLQAPSPEETFQMLASSPLDQLAASTKSMLQAPSLDTSAPDVSFTKEGDVTVLKSGISQKITSLDLTMGKAEVIYLSKPVGRVSISNPDVASALLISPTQVQLIGKGVGVANLLLWGDMYSPDHTVVDINVHRDVSVLTNQLKYVDPGIQIIPMAAEDTVILTGQAENRETAQLAIEMAKAFFAKNAAGAAGDGPSSQAPGSALPGASTNVINLIKVKGEPSTKIQLVRNRLHNIDPNIRVDVVPGPEGQEKVILTGRVANASIASKALNMASVFYGQPGIKLVTAQGGNEYTRMQVSNGSTTSVETSTGGETGAGKGAANMLQGSIMTDATGNVISMLEIAQKPQIKCNIKFLELGKTAMNALGGTVSGARGATKFTSWSGVHGAHPDNPISVPSSLAPPGADWNTRTARNAIGNGWVPTSQTMGSNWNEVFQKGITQVFTINNQMVAAIQALQEKRLARSLAEPTLTILSGEQGSFLAGGEIPLAFVGGNGQISIQFKEYGIRLNLLPTVTDDGKIQMQVAPEVSSVDNSINVQGVPGFFTRKMSTNLIVEPGQSFVLAGLFKQDDIDSVSRFPGIGSLPIIGGFFRNKWKTRNNSEMVVVIKPEIIMTHTGQTQHAMSSPPQAQELKAQLSQK